MPFAIFEEAFNKPMFACNTGKPLPKWTKERVEKSPILRGIVKCYAQSKYATSIPNHDKPMLDKKGNVIEFGFKLGALSAGGDTNKKDKQNVDVTIGDETHNVDITNIEEKFRENMTNIITNSTVDMVSKNELSSNFVSSLVNTVEIKDLNFICDTFIMETNVKQDNTTELDIETSVDNLINNDVNKEVSNDISTKFEDIINDAPGLEEAASNLGIPVGGNSDFMAEISKGIKELGSNADMAVNRGDITTNESETNQSVDSSRISNSIENSMNANMNNENTTTCDQYSFNSNLARIEGIKAQATMCDIKNNFNQKNMLKAAIKCSMKTETMNKIVDDMITNLDSSFGDESGIDETYAESIGMGLAIAAEGVAMRYDEDNEYTPVAAVASAIVQADSPEAALAAAGAAQTTTDAQIAESEAEIAKAEAEIAKYQKSDDDDGLSPGAIAGIVICIIVFCILVGVGIAYFTCKLPPKYSPDSCINTQ